MDEHIAEEMEITLRSYGKVLTKRFIDTVPMSIEN